jgi:tetratricopeptide (TPR) repeat protein
MRLAEPVRHVMAVAAVAGEAVDFVLLSRAAGVEEREAAEAVEHLVRRRILHSVGERLEFSHDRLRETAYATLLPARRRALHRVVGETLEALATPLRDDDDRLAHHFSQAGVADKAVPYLARFAETARHRNAVDDALRSLDRAMTLAQELPLPGRDRTYLDLLLRKGFLLALRTLYHDCLALLTAHRERVEALDDPVITGAYCFRLGMSQAHLGSNDAAAALGRRAIEAGERAGDPRTIGLAHYLLAFTAHLSGRAFREGAAHARQAAVQLEAAGETHYRGLAYWVLSVHLVYLGRFAEALEATRQVAVIAEAFSEPRLWSFGAGVALVRATMGEWQEAVRHADQALERATDTLSRALALSTLGFAHAQGGDADRAIAALREAIDGIRPLGLVRVSESRFTCFLADAYLYKGDAEQARLTAAQALEGADESGYLWGAAFAERSLGLAAQLAGDGKAAEAHLRTALERFEALEAAFDVSRTAFHLARVTHAIGRRSEARALLDQARVQFAAQGVPIWEARAAALAGQLSGGSVPD